LRDRRQRRLLKQHRSWRRVTSSGCDIADRGSHTDDEQRIRHQPGKHPAGHDASEVCRHDAHRNADHSSRAIAFDNNSSADHSAAYDGSATYNDFSAAAVLPAD
jgi:hypothetical protein